MSRLLLMIFVLAFMPCADASAFSDMLQPQEERTEQSSAPQLHPQAGSAAFEDHRQLIATVSAKGILYGFARTCQLPAPLLEALLQKQFAASRDLARTKVPAYTQDDLEKDFGRGIEKSFRFSSAMAPGSAAYKRNCKEIDEKARAIVGGK